MSNTKEQGKTSFVTERHLLSQKTLDKACHLRGVEATFKVERPGPKEVSFNILLSEKMGAVPLPLPPVSTPLHLLNKS